jgi:hypothetical protein
MSFTAYSEFLDELKVALETKNMNAIDNILEYANGGNLDEDEVDDLQEIISESTLYLELQEEEYREMALVLIREREEK